jgi:hypothetical protein
MLRVLENAFDEIVITDEDWAKLEASISQQQQNQVGGTPQAEATGGAEGQGDIEGVIAQLPPQVQAMVMTAIEKGVPPEEAVRQITQRLQGEGKP